MATDASAHRADGRKIIDPPCEFGHTSQAMECPSCCEALGGTSTVEWWEWYRKRTNRKSSTGRSVRRDD